MLNKIFCRYFAYSQRPKYPYPSISPLSKSYNHTKLSKQLFFNYKLLELTPIIIELEKLNKINLTRWRKSCIVVLVVLWNKTIYFLYNFKLLFTNFIQ